MVDREALLAALRHFAGRALAHVDQDAELAVLCSHASGVLAASGAGVMLTTGEGGLEHGAGTDDRVERLQVVQSSTREGPAWRCAESAEPVVSADLRTDERWPAFAATAAETGARAFACVPMLVGERCLGALTVTYDDVRETSHEELEAARALAEAGAALLSNAREHARAVLLAEQLETALTSRVVIEQAKGILAARLDATPDEAFALLRRTARNRRERLHDLARAVIAGTADIDA